MALGSGTFEECRGLVVFLLYLFVIFVRPSVGRFLGPTKFSWRVACEWFVLSDFGRQSALAFVMWLVSFLLVLVYGLINGLFFHLLLHT